MNRSDSNPIRVAIMGCGAVVEFYYAPALLELSKLRQVEVTLLFDPDEKRTARLKEIFSKARSTKLFRDALETDISLAIIASPPRFHAEQTMALLQNGTAILCEKPMAATVAEAEAMVKTAQQSKGLLAVGLFRRFFPSSQMICHIVWHRRLGAARRFEIFEGTKFNWPAQSASFFQRSNSQGGVLADLGVHVLDLLIWWFGMPEKVTYEDDAMGGLEANCHLELEYADGLSGTVRLSRDTELPNRTIIQCEQGWLRCNASEADRLELGFEDLPLVFGGELVSVGNGANSFRKEPASTYSLSFVRQLQNVLAAMQGDEELFISGEKGVLSLRLIEECYRGKRLMPMPWLTKEELSQVGSL